MDIQIIVNYVCMKTRTYAKNRENINKKSQTHLTQDISSETLSRDNLVGR